MTREIIIGTRTSKLAIIQTNWVIAALRKKGVANSIKIKEILTKGDRILNVSLAELGGGGVFHNELEQQLIDGEIDLAVHSLKDISGTIPEALVIAAIPEREDHRDAYIGRKGVLFNDLPAGAIIGTSSLRRAAQLLTLRPDIETKWIRGPVDSRLSQLTAGEFDAIILAVAGLKRLGLADTVITEYLPDDQFVPAVGQGALAIECRKDDGEIQALLKLIHHEASAKATEAERLFLHYFNVGDQAPIGAYAFVENDVIYLRGTVMSQDGQRVLQASASGKIPNEVAREVAEDLISQGAEELIQASKGEEVN